MKKFIAFLEDGWSNLTVGIVGLVFCVIAAFGGFCTGSLDLKSVLIGFFFFMYLTIFGYGIETLFLKRNSPSLEGENK